MRMAFKVFIASVALLVPSPAAAKDNETGKILAVIDTFMRSINETDADLARSIMADDGMKVSRSDAPDRPPIWARRFSEDFQWLQDNDANPRFREVYWDPTILRHGDIAVVWTPYSFDRDGKRSHCGVNVFNLMRVTGEWKITGLQYTVEPGGCPAGR